MLLVKEIYSSPVCDIARFGAVGDGKTQNIRAIERALECAKGGGTVLVPEGGTYLAAPFNLTSNVVLEVSPDALRSSLRPLPLRPRRVR